MTTKTIFSIAFFSIFYFSKVSSSSQKLVSKFAFFFFPLQNSPPTFFVSTLASLLILAFLLNSITKHYSHHSHRHHRSQNHHRHYHQKKTSLIHNVNKIANIIFPMFNSICNIKKKKKRK